MKYCIFCSTSTTSDGTEKIVIDLGESGLFRLEKTLGTPSLWPFCSLRWLIKRMDTNFSAGPVATGERAVVSNYKRVDSD